MFLTEKKDETVKGRMVYNGKPTREWLSRDDAASPTAATESILITGVVDAREKRDIMTNDVPNAFIQATMPTIKQGDERVIMKITGQLVEMLIEIDPKYGQYAVYEKGKKILYVVVLRAIYGMLQAALLWYKKFRGDLESIGFKFNPYDPCVANRMVNNKQHTVLFHVDDLKSSHVDKKVNDDFFKWLQKMYGGHKDVTCTRGLVHSYLGLKLDYSEPGKIKIDMRTYVNEMIEAFPVEMTEKDISPTPAGDDLFGQRGKRNEMKLDAQKKEIFHTIVAKGLFLTNRGRPDIQPTIAYLCTRVRDPTTADWQKLIRMMKYLNGTRELVRTLSAENLGIVKWYVDTSFAVHDDYKSHTGATMLMGSGAIQSISRKQKLNTKSSTHAELVGADDASTMILWTKLFMEAQGYPVKDNILYQDNKSTILLETNGVKSAGKMSRALNVRYFFLTDQVQKGNLRVEYCPTDEMVADFMTKPLQGQKFMKFRTAILGG
jgi:Reverse transcriptase (RNA-dependent DNA polymerase)